MNYTRQRQAPYSQGRKITHTGIVRKAVVNRLHSSLELHGIHCDKDYYYKYTSSEENNKYIRLDVVGNDFIIKIARKNYWENAALELNYANKLVSMRFKILLLYECDHIGNITHLQIPTRDLALIRKQCRDSKISVIDNNQASIDILCKKILEKIPYSTIA